MNKTHINLLTQLQKTYYADWFQLNIENKKLIDSLESVKQEKEQLLNTIKYLQDKLLKHEIAD